jgi:hypothetical protein
LSFPVVHVAPCEHIDLVPIGDGGVRHHRRHFLLTSVLNPIPLHAALGLSVVGEAHLRDFLNIVEVHATYVKEGDAVIGGMGRLSDKSGVLPWWWEPRRLLNIELEDDTLKLERGLCHEGVSRLFYHSSISHL